MIHCSIARYETCPTSIVYAIGVGFIGKYALSPTRLALGDLSCLSYNNGIRATLKVGGLQSGWSGTSRDPMKMLALWESIVMVHCKV